MIPLALIEHSDMTILLEQVGYRMPPPTDRVAYVSDYYSNVGYLNVIDPNQPDVADHTATIMWLATHWSKKFMTNSVWATIAVDITADQPLDAESMMIEACLAGNLPVVLYILDKKDITLDHDLLIKVLECAAEHGLPIVRCLLPSAEPIDLDKIDYLVCVARDLPSFAYTLKMWPMSLDGYDDYLIDLIVGSGYLATLMYTVGYLGGISDDPIESDTIIYVAIKGYLNVMKYIADFVTLDDIIFEMVCFASENGHYALVRYLVSLTDMPKKDKKHLLCECSLSSTDRPKYGQMLVNLGVNLPLAE